MQVKTLPDHDGANGWSRILRPPAPARRLTGDVRVSTVVIGAGICGLSAARRLGELGADDPIAVLEAERVGEGASGMNAGFLMSMHAHGPPKELDVLRRNRKFWTAGLEDLRRIVRDHQIQCGWSEAGRTYAAAGPDGDARLEEMAETLSALEAPFEHQGAARLEADLSTTFYRQAIHAPDSALVNPAALMRGLAAALPENVTVYEETPALRLERDGERFVVSTPDGTVTADRVVVAAGVFMRHLGVATGRYVPMALYASLTEPLTDADQTPFRPEQTFGVLPASANGPTVRLTRDGRLFIRNVASFTADGRIDKRKVDAAAALHRSALQTRWPSLERLEIAHRWSGVMAFTSNNGAVFGEIEPGIFAVLSNDVSPMSRGAISGRLLAEHMHGVASPLLDELLAMPEAARLPPRPFLDLGIAWKLRKLRRSAPDEF